MEQVIIEHRLGKWTITVHESYNSVPAKTITFANSDRGFPSKGHAIGYIKRVANHTPDRSSEFHIYPYTNHENKIRWDVMICDSGN
jgi:beta-glucanase (GH16 family)